MMCWRDYCFDTKDGGKTDEEDYETVIYGFT